MTLKIVSGGQTGVDRAALDVALEAGVPCGGWCPRGRGSEDGPIPSRYPLRETPDASPEQRTAWNVRDSDGTLVLARGRLRGGTRRTVEGARALGRPLRVVDLSAGPEVGATRAWLRAEGIQVLNVAGPRESEEPGITEAARPFLQALLAPAEPSPPAGKNDPSGAPRTDPSG